jgi:uncharacterized protein (DUF885 family)
MRVKRIVLAILVMTIAAGGWWSYRLVWGRPLNIDHFYERIFIKLLLDDPELLTQLGFIDNTWLDFHSDDLTDSSPEHTEKLNRMVDDNLATLLEYDYEDLSESQQLSADILRWYLEDLKRGQPFSYHDYSVNQLYGVHNYLPSFMDAFHRVVNERSARNYIERLQKFPKRFDQVLAGLELREEKHIIPPRFVIEKVLVDARAFVAQPLEENVLYASFKAKVDTLSTLDGSQKEAFYFEVRQTIEESVIPSYEKLIAYLEGLEVKSTTDDGVWKLPDGDAYYAYLLAHHTTTDMTPEEVHQIGLEEVARIQAEMRVILDSLGYEGKTVAEHMQDLAQEDRFLYDNTDSGRAQILSDYQAIIDEIDQNLSGIFRLRPKTGVKVKRVPEFKEKTAPAAYYIPPALDGSRPGVFYANLRDLKEQPKFGMRTLAYHEAVPGHHFQFALQQELSGVPTFRNVIPFTAYAEGWALYAERLAAEYGFERDPYSDLGRLQAELFRAVRLVVDTGIHHERWTRERAIEYMIATTGMPRGDVVAEVERYIVMPGQACAYKIGMMKILELRKRARSELGERFDIQDFHAAVLQDGAMPLPILERRVEAYIRGVQSS